MALRGCLYRDRAVSQKAVPMAQISPVQKALKDSTALLGGWKEILLANG